MYNTDLPRRADLPSSTQLKRSTWIAGIAASAILVLVVLPSEYAIDPTGIGRVLGLTQMGEIKIQLAEEAAQDAGAVTMQSVPIRPITDLQIAERLSRIEGILVQISDNQVMAPPLEIFGSASPSEISIVEEELETPAAKMAREEKFAELTPELGSESSISAWRDELSVVLKPGQGTEIKLVMQEGDQAEFFWTANGSMVNYDTHGDGGGNSISYEKGRGVADQQGTLEAAFSGNHGWFWRNRTDTDVTLTLRTRGTYSNMKRAM